VPPHRREQRHHAVEVVPIIGERPLARLPDGLQPREVDHAVDRVLGKRAGERLLVAHVDLIERE